MSNTAGESSQIDPSSSPLVIGAAASRMTGGNGRPSLSEPTAPGTPPSSETTEINAGAEAHEEGHAFAPRENSRKAQDLGPWLPDLLLCGFGTGSCAGMG